MKPKKSLLQKIAYLYGISFFLVIVLAFIPGLTDENGKIFGLYRNVTANHVLHALSGIWALYAASKSEKSTLFYFRVFGILYFLDGLSGLLTGYNFLNLHFLTKELAIIAAKRLAANTPHMLIGGIAIFLGFIVDKNYSRKSRKKSS